MKQCPQCRQNYDDDNLNFCLSDGEPLVSESEYLSEETKIRSIFTPPPPPVIKQGVHPIFAYLALGLMSLIIVGAVIFWLKSNSGNSLVPPTPSPSEQLSTNPDEQKVNLPGGAEKEQSKPVEDPKQAESKKVEPTPSPTKPPVQPSGGTWFVVLGSYPKNESEKANQRLRYVRSLGYNATLVETSNYPGLRSGLSAVVIGPSSKTDARNLLGRIKSSVPDAYIKSGW